MSCSNDASIPLVALEFLSLEFALLVHGRDIREGAPRARSLHWFHGWVSAEGGDGCIRRFQSAVLDTPKCAFIERATREFESIAGHVASEDQLAILLVAVEGSDVGLGEVVKERMGLVFT